MATHQNRTVAPGPGVSLPSPEELFPWRVLVRRHQNFLTESRVQWAMRNRHSNGLVAASAVFVTQAGGVLLHEPAFLTWFLSLSGRAKPRSTRRRCTRA